MQEGITACPNLRDPKMEIEQNAHEFALALERAKREAAEQTARPVGGWREDSAHRAVGARFEELQAKLAGSPSRLHVHWLDRHMALHAESN